MQGFTPEESTYGDLDPTNGLREGSFLPFGTTRPGDGTMGSQR